MAPASQHAPPAEDATALAANGSAAVAAPAQIPPQAFASSDDHRQQEAASGDPLSAVTPTDAHVARPGGSKAAKSFTPTKTATYLSPEYWDSRFAEEESYEWCKDYSAFRHLLRPHLRAADAILELGCGNSGLGAALVADGFPNVTCIDLSATVIQRMAARAAAAGEAIKYQVADMLRLPFANGSFDVVLEKGAIEVFFTDSESAWDPQPAVRQRVAAALGEAHRVLTPGGVFVSISFGQPHFRAPLFLADPAHTWSCDVKGFGDTFEYFVYVLRKGRREGLEGAAADGPTGADQPVRLGPGVRARGTDEEAHMHAHMDEEDYLMRMAL